MCEYSDRFFGVEDIKRYDLKSLLIFYVSMGYIDIIRQL